ncbi:MAG: ATP-binding cassette domain-containing protein [Deltaproteobacteria bacterium]|nr:ATP-binding cassette domain-containing protein [Deltaproteobacteria bacterium]
MILKVENLSKNFKTVKAVDGITFEVAKGEVVGLLGPNGAGKTTAMRLVTGYLKPDSGSVTVNGIDMEENPIEAKAQIGYLPENAPSYHDMEVTEFLTYIALLRGVSKEAVKTRLEEALHLCGLKEVIGRPIGQLSRGYKQRVCLAQALIHKPPLLILDEPTTGLDPHQIQEIRALIREIGRERTVILSTHIMQEVQAVCGRVLIIARGNLVGAGTPEELMQKGQGGSRYFAKIKAPRADIENAIGSLSEFVLGGFRATHGEWQTLILKCPAAENKSEAIFKWVVANRWSLSELKRESSSLEDIFLELTR